MIGTVDALVGTHPLEAATLFHHPFSLITSTSCCIRTQGLISNFCLRLPSKVSCHSDMIQ